MALSTPLRNRLPSSAQRQAADRHHIILVPGLDQDIPAQDALFQVSRPYVI